MAGKRAKQTKSKLDTWLPLLPLGGLLLGVFVVLTLAAGLQAEPEQAARAWPPPSPASEPPAAPSTLPTPQPTSRPVVQLEQRALDDRQRLTRRSGNWTLQFMLACDPDNVSPKASSLAGESEFYLLPKRHDSRDCFRVCWGSYDSREQALAARNFPRELAAITLHPQPLPVEQLVR